MDERLKLKLLLRYAGAGFHIFPLHWPTKEGTCSCKDKECGRIGKHPHTPNGVKDATTKKDVIEAWHSTWPEANWAVATGESSGIVVLDVDLDSGGEEALKAFRIPLTATVTTGSGGRHYYFKHPRFLIKNSASRLGPGLDIRGENGYVVIPPSIHVSGNPYEWTIKPKDVGIREIPQDLLKNLSEIKGERIKAEEDGFIREGKRNEMLISMAGWMRYRGFNGRAMKAALWAVNIDALEPPLSREEVYGIVESALRWEKGKRK